MTPEQAAERICWKVLNSHDDEAFKDVLEIIHAQRAEAVAEAMVWRPIETAPKDKRVLLLTEHKAQYVGQWVKNPFDGQEAFLICSHEPKNPNGNNQIIVLNATHWMPLPPAPQEGEG